MTLAALLLAVAIGQAPEAAQIAPGSMWITNPEGQQAMPMTLTHTDVHAQIAGFGARVTVTQSFNNPSPTPIEAVYTFPLPDDAAVDKMAMHIGERVVVGEIKQRDEARQIYEAAKNAGQSAALLDQERPNVFTQSVANIMPGKKIEVQISYVELLKYSDSQFEFSFPMVVGPRFIGSGVKDGLKIAPPITAPGTRTGQTVSLALDIDAGAPILDIESVLHKIDVEQPTLSTAHVELRRADEIPNRDFILRYRMATDSVRSAFVSSYDSVKGGQFALIVMPPKRPAPTQISPREIIFVIDRSGSQSGFPIEKSKELTLKLMSTLRAGDTFNVISFGMTCTPLWTRPRPYTETTAQEAAGFIKPLHGEGGTNVEGGITEALRAQNDSGRTRIVLLNTDGFIGNEGAVLKAIHDGRGTARVFTFGIGNSVNRYVIDAMATEGRGDAEYVTLAEKADAAVERLTKRLETPVLVNVSAAFSGTPVDECTPANIPDLFDEKPIVILGHYETPGTATVVLKGEVAGQPWSQTLTLNLSSRPDATAIPTLWARKRIDDIERKRLECRLTGDAEAPNVDQQIENVALSYGIVSSQTSFVAVEQRIVNIEGRPRTVRVPVEMADGVSYKGIVGGPVSVQFAGANVSQLSSSGLSGGFGGGGGLIGGLGGPGGPGARGATSTPPPSVPTHVQGVTSTAQNVPALIGGQGLVPNGVAVKSAPESKIAKALKKATGKVTVQVSLSKLDDETLKLLKDAGLKIDDKDATLKVVFGTVDAEKLKQLAEIEQVERIDPLE